MAQGAKVTDLAGIVAADINLNDLLYLALSSGTDRDRKVTVEALRDAIVNSEKKEILSPSLTTWPLAGAPTRPDLSRLFIQGQKQVFGIDYVINGILVTWLGYALKPAWKIEIYYF